MKSKFSYSNVVSTIALFLALTGGVAYAASKIGTHDLKRQAVTAKKIRPGAIKTGKLANGAVTRQQVADGSVNNRKVKDDSIQPDKLTFPVFYTATPSGGSQAVTGGPDPYPLTDEQWTQRANAVNVIFGETTATLAYDGSGSGSCQVYFDVRLDGQQVGGGQLQTGSTTPESVTASLGAAPGSGPQTPTERTLSIQVSSNGDCETGSTIDSSNFQVLNFG